MTTVLNKVFERIKRMESIRLLIICICLLGFSFTANAQQKEYSTIAIRGISADKFAFTKNWLYRWDILKDDNGKFHSLSVDKVKPADTAHVYFTANCKTNVQGGYAINHCYANFKTDTIALTFIDGDRTMVVILC